MEILIQALIVTAAGELLRKQESNLKTRFQLCKWGLVQLWPCVQSLSLLCSGFCTLHYDCWLVNISDLLLLHCFYLWHGIISMSKNKIVSVLWVQCNNDAMSKSQLKSNWKFNCSFCLMCVLQTVLLCEHVECTIQNELCLKCWDDEMHLPVPYNILSGNCLLPFVSVSAWLPLSHHRNAGVGVEWSHSDGKDLWRSAVHLGPAMCRGGALCETVSYRCHHLSLYPTETPTYLATIWWLCTHVYFLYSLRSFIFIPHPFIWQISHYDYC